MSWQGIVGAERVRAAGPDDAVDGVRPREVVTPASRDMLSEVVATAERTSAALVVATGRAHLTVGGAPRACDALVDLSSLDRVVDHPAADMTVTVEAGCRLATLETALAAAGQWLPIDPPIAAATTIGGLVATNAWGPLRASQGSVRDLLLGLRVVGTGGCLTSSGGRVVKNVAGYDLPKLHVGALGTLGVVVEATFKVRPRPDEERAGTMPTTSHADAVGLALAIREAMDPFWLVAGDLPDGRVGVAVGVAGTATAVRSAAGIVEEVGRRAGAAVDWDVAASTGRRALADFSARSCAAVLRASVLPTDVAWALERVAAHAGSVPRLAHPTTGVVHALLEEPETVATVVATLRAELAGRGGFLVVERARAQVKRGLDVWGDPGEGLALMRRVKATFDPRGVFAPGRFVGGI